jgi:hypothetical protein
MSFNELKVIPTVAEFAAAKAGDDIYEAIDAYKEEHPDFSTINIVAILAMLGASHIEDIRVLLAYLFGGKYGIRGFLDRAINIAWMLERDNDLLAPND